MSVLSTNRLSSGLGAVSLGVFGLGAVAVVALLRHRSLKQSEKSKDEAESTQNSQETEEPLLTDSDRALKSRIGNFKISKLKNMVQGIAEDLDTKIEFDWDKAADGCAQTEGDHCTAEHAIDGNDATEWERQVADECRTFKEAARILCEVRGSDTHRKLGHFYVVDRQLSQMVAQFNEISERVLEFPWREHRDDPISDLMQLAFVRLAADGGQQALLPVSQGFVKCTAAQDTRKVADTQDQASQDELLLGIESGASKDLLESSFRHKARKMHAHGQCIDLEAFHELNNAYSRCIARMMNSGYRHAYRGGSKDILAHYLLIGTDPSESRYGEAVSGILDALQLERLLIALDVLRSWGEVSGTATGLGDG